MLVGEEPLGRELGLSAELGHGGVEVACACRQVAKCSVEAAHAQACSGRVGGIDCRRERIGVFAYVPEHGPLERTCEFGGAEHPQDAVMGGVARGGELPRSRRRLKSSRCATRLVSCAQVTAPQSFSCSSVEASEAGAYHPAPMRSLAMSLVHTWTW